MGRKESNETKQMSTFNYQTPIHQLSLICTFNLQWQLIFQFLSLETT